jgi:hypothetical protein
MDCGFEVNFPTSDSQTEYRAMPVEKLSKKAIPESTPTRGTRFPANDLKSSIEVPRLLHVKGGGSATPDQLAAHLGYSGTNNGAYLNRVAAAVAFGLIQKVGPVYQPTTLAHHILSPTYPHDTKKALVDAFFNVQLFKQIYDEFKGKELPPEFGMKNALKLTYGVAPNRLAEAYKSLMESAETAGFFETKNGARTHLILPLIQAIPGAAMPKAEEPKAPVHGGGSGGGEPPKDSALGDVKAKYVATLIKLFEDRAANGEIDEKLMERIERLIGVGGSAA